jgi:hypothetical protein
MRTLKSLVSIAPSSVIRHVRFHTTAPDLVIITLSKDIMHSVRVGSYVNSVPIAKVFVITVISSVISE